MSNFLPSWSVTRIRGELHASPKVVDLLSAHVGGTVSSEMYTSARAVVDQGDFRRDVYHDALERLTERTGRVLGDRALALAPPLRILENSDGSGYLSVKEEEGDKDLLGHISDEFRSFPGYVRGERDGPDMLYFELARGAISRGGARMAQLRALNAAMKVALGDSDVKHTMTAKGLAVVTRDFMVITNESDNLPLAE